jgi:hypothetical protein
LTPLPAAVSNRRLYSRTIANGLVPAEVTEPAGVGGPLWYGSYAGIEFLSRGGGPSGAT